MVSMVSGPGGSDCLHCRWAVGAMVSVVSGMGGSDCLHWAGAMVSVPGGSDCLHCRWGVKPMVPMVSGPGGPDSLQCRWAVGAMLLWCIGCLGLVACIVGGWSGLGGYGVWAVPSCLGFGARVGLHAPCSFGRMGPGLEG